ncbi:MAG: 1-deoxy-D-xylulose 5-phosphate reductoisomerase [uncultured Gemmatimonadaceae bacterium]|uniref:1-deoxy-D-xylulose 5-phosphate reductoisomerase n=1 Tax=uncultured Gemmatimonadaceae bacterium TaxID=246130 RepID=A0A6J4KLT1_9BACT|nr:MAG: 1-deoxy-D-xylulose 5-phosphate reductoisomerase [uncultured Gemmatimonadaceae bacterium]
MTPRGVAILGSTGSVGTTALRVLARQRERFRVVALTAHDNAALLAEQAAEFGPSYVALVRDTANRQPGWMHGAESLVAAATRPDADVVLNAVVGAAGLDATLAALTAGKRVALANKETLVVAGALVMATARRHGGEVVPVDSEHSAILQCIGGRPAREVRRLVLTASGGPFREWDSDRIDRVTVADALRHPTWQMGRKITIDSATLANKALEVIEAHHLFGLDYARIEVVVHPQSVIHSFVEFVDGSVLAQMGTPTMELPVLYALTHPERVPDSGVPAFDPAAASPLTFEPVRAADFPALALGIAAGRAAGAAPAVYNAANEQAVALFLDGRCGFRDIPRSIERALGTLAGAPGETREQLLEADAAARALVARMFAC